MKEYTLHLPEGYVPPPLPGRDEWTAELRSGRHKQGFEVLCNDDGEKCCLGVLCSLQGRITKCGIDGRNGNKFFLNKKNPMHLHLLNTGEFPDGVKIEIEDDYQLSLADCNDAGLTFSQIADIIEQVWADGGPLLK